MVLGARRISGWYQARTGRRADRSFRLRLLVRTLFAVSSLLTGVQLARFCNGAPGWGFQGPCGRQILGIGTLDLPAFFFPVIALAPAALLGCLVPEARANAADPVSLLKSEYRRRGSAALEVRL